MKDAALLALINKGDPTGLEAVIDRYAPYVAAVIRRQLGGLYSPEDAEELAADAFVSLWKSAEKIRSAELRGWLGATARNAARTHLRRLGELHVCEEDVILVDGENAERLLEKSERARYIERALRALGPPDSEIFIRHYYYNQSTAVVSAEMGLNPSTVKSKLRRGRQKLREELEREGFTCET